ncbi:hypothetical protein HY642_04680 [Candidatus Woesearchaeota archaeon]|nr:hypothetical protein [Candidatus Woesearchaeota archaeon]
MREGLPGRMLIPQATADSVVNLCLDTLGKDKQALVFVNTKKSAEKAAEDISRHTKLISPGLTNLAEQVLNVLSKPTRQCERLALCVKHGAAFHHAGLHARQKELVEDAFRQGVIRIIACTPTLAYGLDLPAFRAIIRDVRRYGSRGLDFIPVLEFLQMAGRAGRPRFDKWGEAIAVAHTAPERDEIAERYIHGEPEAVYSKLAVEPVLRTALLSLIAGGFANTGADINNFFSKTFWAHQFSDMARLQRVIDAALASLEEWELVSSDGEDFVAANELGNTKYAATRLGKRVAELYVDPWTAHYLVTCLRKAASMTVKPFSFLHAVCRTTEMRPPLSVRQKEFDELQVRIAGMQQVMLEPEPSLFDEDYDEFLAAIKTAFMLEDWMEEKDDEWMLDTYNVRPGETRAKLERAEWLLYATGELAALLDLKTLTPHIRKTRVRLRYGIKEELVPLVKLEGIGRVRARMLFRNGFKNLAEVKNADIGKLSALLGKQVAVSVKKQLGEHVLEEVPLGKRKGQLPLGKYDS